MSWFYATYRSKAKNNRTGSSVQVRPSQQDRVNATWNQWQRTERQSLTIRRGSERTVVATVLQRWTHFYYFVTHPGCVLEYWLLFFFLSPSSISLCVYTTLYPFTIMDAQMVSGLGSLQIRRLWTPITNLGVEMMLPSCLNALFTSAVCWGERNFFPQGCDHPLRFWSHFPRESRSILGSFFWSVPKR